jgi:hypothetical protein
MSGGDAAFRAPLLRAAVSPVFCGFVVLLLFFGSACAGKAPEPAHEPSSAASGSVLCPPGAPTPESDDSAAKRAIDRASQVVPSGATWLLMIQENRVKPIEAWPLAPSRRSNGGVRALVAARYLIDGREVSSHASSTVPAELLAKAGPELEVAPRNRTAFDTEEEVLSSPISPGEHVLGAELAFLDGWCCAYGGACYPTGTSVLREKRRVRVEAMSTVIVRYIAMPGCDGAPLRLLVLASARTGATRWETAR